MKIKRGRKIKKSIKLSVKLSVKLVNCVGCAQAASNILTILMTANWRN